LQLRDLLLDDCQLLIQKFLHMRAGGNVFGSEDQKLTDLIQGKSQFLSFAHEFQRLNIVGTK